MANDLMAYNSMLKIIKQSDCSMLLWHYRRLVYLTLNSITNKIYSFLYHFMRILLTNNKYCVS